jgi:hypothetical protein
VADAVEAVGHGVLQEAADELVGQVSFTWKDYRQDGKTKVMTRWRACPQVCSTEIAPISAPR